MVVHWANDSSPVLVVLSRLNQDVQLLDYHATPSLFVDVVHRLVE